MTKAKWKDVTSYSRDKDREPRAWELELVSPRSGITVRICVHKHIHYEDQWLVTCHAVHVDKLETGCRGEEGLATAKKIALDVVRGVILDMAKLIEGIEA
jgi:hypothetical protein